MSNCREFTLLCLITSFLSWRGTSDGISFKFLNYSSYSWGRNYYSSFVHYGLEGVTVLLDFWFGYVFYLERFLQVVGGKDVSTLETWRCFRYIWDKAIFGGVFGLLAHFLR